MKNKIISISIFPLVAFWLLEGSSMANMFFFTSKYQKDIKVELLLLNKADVINVLSGGGEKDINHSKAFNNDINLVVRLKNIGNKGAWGTLVCNVEGYKDIQVYVPHLTPNMKEFINFVIPLSGMINPRPKDNPPTIESKWEKLSSK